MLRTTVITGLLSSRLMTMGDDAPVYPVTTNLTGSTGAPVNLPDRVVLVVLTPGVSPMMENIIERPGLQVRCRGKQNIYEDAEDLMWKVDHILMVSAFPLTFQGVYFLPPEYSGGTPSALPIDDGGRTVFVGNYILQVEVRSAVDA
jgi:Bacteriophage minor capsid protein